MRHGSLFSLAGLRIVPLVAALALTALPSSARPEPSAARPELSAAQPEPSPEQLRHSVQQLRDVIGRWRVTTRLLGAGRAVVREVEGHYEFGWVVPDRVVSGRSDQPALNQTSAVLFYVSETRRLIEMVSVGADGVLWVMRGPLGSETRTTAPFPLAGGGSGMLRFTRQVVSRDQFESHMEFSDDGGLTWQPRNLQVFRRIAPAPG
jgi:hypothetical protein